jgi:hypothetical protein
VKTFRNNLFMKPFSTFRRSLLLSFLLLFFFLSHGHRIVSGPEKKYKSNNQLFIDRDVRDFPEVLSGNPAVFQLVSHGRPGKLLLDGKWRDAKEIAAYMQSEGLIPSEIRHLNIYGCAFAKGIKGKRAVAYLERKLHISIAASNDVTGNGGNWILEVGKSINVLNLPEYKGNLQCAGVVGGTGPNDDFDGDGVCNSVDIVACNNGKCDTTYITLNPPVHADTVMRRAACPTCPATACVVGDDLSSLDGATFSSCGTPAGYSMGAVDTNGCITYIPNGSVTDTVKTCICNGDRCDTTYVVLYPPVTKDTVIKTPACPTCLITACVVGDDLGSLNGATFSTCGSPAGYTAGTPTANGCVTYTLTGAINTSPVQTCIVACKDGLCDTTIVIINAPILNDTLSLTPDCPTCTVTACALADEIGPLSGATYTTCGVPAGFTASAPTSNGCVTYTPTGTANATAVQTCIVACNNGLCDTTIVYLNPPISKDTVISTPACPSCVVTACVVGDDLDSLNGATFTTCGAPAGYAASTPNASGCITFTPNGPTITVPVQTCIVACNNGKCDTSILIIKPPITKDTVTQTPACPTCTVTACVVGDDLGSLSGATFSTCGVPAGFTASTPTANGCVTFTPTGATITVPVQTCIVACNNGKCDTSILIIKPPIL